MIQQCLTSVLPGLTCYVGKRKGYINDTIYKIQVINLNYPCHTMSDVVHIVNENKC